MAEAGLKCTFLRSNPVCYPFNSLLACSEESNTLCCFHPLWWEISKFPLLMEAHKPACPVSATTPISQIGRLRRGGL